MFAHITAHRPSSTTAPLPIQFEDACLLPSRPQAVCAEELSLPPSRPQTVRTEELSHNKMSASQEESPSSTPSPVHAAAPPDHDTDESDTPPAPQERDSSPPPSQVHAVGINDQGKAENASSVDPTQNETYPRPDKRRYVDALTGGSEASNCKRERPISRSNDSDSFDNTTKDGSPVNVPNMDEDSLTMHIDETHHVPNDQSSNQ